MVKTPKFPPLVEKEIYVKRQEGKRLYQLAEEYGVSSPTIAKICERVEERERMPTLDKTDLKLMIDNAKDIVRNAKKGTEMKAAVVALQSLLVMWAQHKDEIEESGSRSTNTSTTKKSGGFSLSELNDL